LSFGRWEVFGKRKEIWGTEIQALNGKAALSIRLRQGATPYKARRRRE